MKTKNRLTMKQITDRVLNLVPGHSFTVETSSQRVMALQAAKLASRAGLISHQIVSRKINKGGFRIAAL